MAGASAALFAAIAQRIMTGLQFRAGGAFAGHHRFPRRPGPSIPCRIRILPTRVEPVKAILATRGSAQSSAPMPAASRPGTIQHPRRDARTLGQRRKRRQFREPRNHGAARRQSRGDLARQHGIGEIPGREATHDADGLADHVQALVLHMPGNGIALDALGLFGEPFDIGRAMAISPRASARGLSISAVRMRARSS